MSELMDSDSDNQTECIKNKSNWRRKKGRQHVYYYLTEVERDCEWGIVNKIQMVRQDRRFGWQVRGVGELGSGVWKMGCNYVKIVPYDYD